MCGDGQFSQRWSQMYSKHVSGKLGEIALELSVSLI